MRKKICNHPGCSSLIDNDKRYCEKHQPEKKVPFQNAVRSNEGLYNTHKWKLIKKEILKAAPYCNLCGISKNEAQLDIHHIIPPRGNEDLFYDVNNIIPICKSCHRTLTNQEISNRKR